MGYQQDYINKLMPYIQYYAPKYNVLCPSAVMAQACIETGCGNATAKSNTLCWTYHNHFGMKAGSSWTGGTYTTGTHEGTGKNRYSTTANWRTYPSLAAGIEGYFIFTSTSRYANTRGVSDPYTYLYRIGQDGYHTSGAANYANQGMSYIRRYNLTQYDGQTVSSLPNGETTNYNQTSDAVVEVEHPQIFTAQDVEKKNQWGVLRYFEEVNDPSIGQAKANMLLQLYNRKTRELKISDAFGDLSVRGGTLIPVLLNLGDIQTSNYMLVDKVTHKFEKDSYTMDLTLEGAWDD